MLMDIEKAATPIIESRLFAIHRDDLDVLVAGECDGDSAAIDGNVGDREATFALAEFTNQVGHFFLELILLILCGSRAVDG